MLRIRMAGLPFLLFFLIFQSSSCRGPVSNPIGDADQDEAANPGDSDIDGDAPDLPDGPDSMLDPLAVTGVLPNHGPFVGGTEVVVRGRGFTEDVAVFFGSREVDPVDLQFVDDNRVVVRTPPGDPGVVDVTVELGSDRASLEEGFTYDHWYLDPQSGSIAGGTLVRIIGMRAEFSPESTVTFRTAEATDVQWHNADELSCRTPPGVAGNANVTISNGETSDLIRDGFTYYDASDPRNGGLGGGPIAGTIDVTVLDGMTRAPLPNSFVILGTDPGTPFKGSTDALGRITFSDPSLEGRQTITAAHGPVDAYGEGGEIIGQTYYESMTIVAFDASFVTILLEPIPPPQPGPPPPGRRGGHVEGELLFEHQGEFGPYEWEIVPEPNRDANEVKVALVYTTQSSVRSNRSEPGAEGTVFNRAEYIGVNGYRFRIYASPGTHTVYAMAGIGRVADVRNPEPPIYDFVPFVMGVTRGIVVGPGESVQNVQVLMTRQMSRTLSVELENAPLASESGTPNLYRVETYLDLGAEGVISRPETTIRAPHPFVSFEFPGWVDLTGNLEGASYTVVAGAWTTWDGFDEEQNPWSVVYRTGVTDLDEPVVIDEFLAIPRATSPEPGGLVVDNRMEWEAEGGVTPDFTMATLSIPSGISPVPYWQIILRGGETSYEFPNLPALSEELSDHPQGDMVWQIWSFSVPGFEFDSWSYRYLNSRYWSAYAVDSWYIWLRE